MSAGLLFLVDRCDTERRKRTPQGYGGKPAYTAHLSDEPCRLTAKTQRGFNSITGEWQVTTNYMLHMQHGADILEGDRLTQIRLQDGTVLDQKYEVDGGALDRRGRMSQIKLVSLKKVA